jgi:hypothetical protein
MSIEYCFNPGHKKLLHSMNGYASRDLNGEFHTWQAFSVQREDYTPDEGFFSTQAALESLINFTP